MTQLLFHLIAIYFTNYFISIRAQTVKQITSLYHELNSTDGMSQSWFGRAISLSTRGVGSPLAINILSTTTDEPKPHSQHARERI